MKRFALSIALAAFVFGLFIQGADAAKWTSGMNEGKPEFKSMGPLAFGPDGVLFIADAKGAAITAIATGDTKPASNAKQLQVEAINQKIAALLGASADQILINDLAVNPISRNAYLAVSRGRGADAVPALIRVKADGQPEVVSLDKVKFSRADLPDPPADAMVGQGNRQSNPRLEAITDIGFLDGRLFVAGLANEEFASTLRAIPFPFKTVASGTSVEIYHGAHGRFETRAPVRTFTTFKIGKEDHLLAAYTCTPLVQFPISELKSGRQDQRQDHRRARQPQPPARYDRLREGRQDLPADGQQQPRRDEDYHRADRQGREHHRACGRQEGTDLRNHRKLDRH